MKTTSALCFAAFTVCAHAADDQPQIASLTVNGREPLQNVTVLKVEPDGLRVQHTHGVAKVKFEDLPPEMQEQFGYDPDKAAAFRVIEQKEREARAEAERLARVQQFQEEQRSSQDADVARARAAFRQLLDSDEYEFAAVDKALVESIAILKAAGRDDLAALLEEDRKLLAAREVGRPSERYRRERRELYDRIHALEDEVARLSNQPPPQNVIVEEVTPWPFIIDRPVVVPVEVPVPAPCPAHSHSPIIAPIISPVITPVAPVVRPVCPPTVTPPVTLPATPPVTLTVKPVVKPQVRPASPIFTPRITPVVRPVTPVIKPAVRPFTIGPVTRPIPQRKS